MGLLTKAILEGIEDTSKAVAKESKVPRAIGKKAEVIPPPFERAPAKSKEEIESIAQRIAPQITGEFVRINPKQSVNPAGLSKKRFELEKELEHDIRPVSEVKVPSSFDYPAHEGKVQIGVFGDPTIAQHDIYSVAGRELAEPSRQFGGPRYPMYEPEDAWASNFGAASGVQSLAERASKQYGDVDVTGLYTKMGPASYGFAQHVSDALMKNIMTSLPNMTKKDIAGFNRMVRNNPAAKDFAGIENPDISLAQMEKNSEMRKQFYNLATTPKYTEAFNMPNGLDVVHATLEPELRNLETGVTGHSIVELDPSIKHLHAAEHPTYDTRIPRKASTEVTQTEVPVPYELQFPDQLLAISKNPKQAPQPFGTLMMSGARQIIDPQLIDELGLYREFIKKYTGKKKGGDVHMAGGGKLVKALLEGAEKLGKKTAHELAHEKAQKNAVEMLGLHPENTAIDRARAMGFDVDNPVYHGTTSDIKEIDPGKFGTSTETYSGESGFWSSDDPLTAKSFADYAAYYKPVNKNPRLMHLTGKEVKRKYPNRRQNIIPMYINKSNMLSSDQGGKAWSELMDNPELENKFSEILDRVNYGEGKVGEFKNFHDAAAEVPAGPATHYFSPKPSAYRSVHAAFDPAEAESGDLLKAKGGIVKDMVEEFADIVKGVKKPEVNRIDMNYKDVTKRVPELTEAANKLDRGEISAADYDYLVNLYKPVKPYDFVPQPATEEDAMRALSKNKQPMFKRAHEIEVGEPTDLRLDIPAYRDHGVWINSIHRKDAPTVYDTVSSVKNATMIGAPEKALKVAKGETSKSPFAVIRGEWNPTDEKEAVEKAQQYLNDKDWIQVGYDPERHGYFYNRSTMEPIESAEEVIQIGPLVLARNPKYAQKSKQKFKQGGSINLEDELKLADISHAPKFAKGGEVDDLGYIEQDPTAYLMNEIKPVDTKITSAEQFRKAIGKPTPYVNEAIQSLIEDTKRIKPRGIIDVPVNAALEFAGLPSEFMNPEDVISPYRQDVVMPKSKAKGYKLPQVFPSGEELKQSVKDIGLTEDDYPALQTMASFLGAPEAKVIGTGAAKAATQGIKGVGKLAKETLKHGARLVEEGRIPGLVDPRMNIIKDPGGMVVGGERELDRQLTDMYKNESIDNYDGTYGHDQNAAALNNWVNTKVRKYIRNQAGTENDPILKAIESGVEHNFAPAIGDTKYYVKHKRALVGKPEEGIAKTDLGKEWEYKVDSTFTPKKSADIKEILNNPMGFVDPDVADRRRASLLRVEHDLPIHDEKDLEALKLINHIPDENIYTIDVSSLTNRLGLNHVGDVLYEDLASGRITPQQLDQMSIEKAVRRAAEYDAQKAKEMAKAHATSVEGMPVPKQYDDGFKWVELKHPEDKTKTAAALKSEGEMMGHCVGSYCPQVESGHTKIYSLRGPDNKSHVTIEVTKRNHLNDWLDANKEEIEKDPLLKQMAYYDPDEKYPGMYSQEEVEQAYINDITKMLRAKGAPVHEAKNTWMDIEQIKGKQNKRPDDKYQKYVTDFIQNNPTGHEIADIRELNNTNLRDVQELIATGISSKAAHMHPDTEKAVAKMYPHLADKFSKHGWSEEIGDSKYELFKDIARDFANQGKYYVTDEDILNAIRAKHLTPPKKKTGGPITKKDLEIQMKLDDIIDLPQLRRRYG